MEGKWQLWLDLNGLDLISSSTLQSKPDQHLNHLSFISPEEVTVEFLEQDILH